MSSYIFSVALVLIIATLYAIFDVFNKRNVPDLFAYASIVIGFIALILFNKESFALGMVLALIMGVSGFLLYKSGLLGAGDFFEFIAIALILPLQPVPLIATLPQFNLPFVLSVFIATGYAVAFAIPINYLLLGKKTQEDKKYKPDKKSMISGVATLFSYFLFLIFVSFITPFKFTALLIIVLMAVPSSIVLIYGRLINFRMVSFIYPKELEDGDMIALHMMEEGDISFFKKRDKSFGRLATNEIIKSIKTANKKIPVYRNAVPLALFTLIGIIIALLFGNILLFISV